MLHMNLRGRLLAAAVAAAGALALAPTALAATDATWAGLATGANASLWSNGGANGANWVGGSVPTSPIGLLTFPDLPSCDTAPPAGAACYSSTDDLGATTVNTLSFTQPTTNEYMLGAGGNSAITLEGNTSHLGLTATQAAPSPGNPPFTFASIAVPLTLGAPQTWDITNGTIIANSVTGVADPLTLDLSVGQLEVGNLATGPVTVAGFGNLQLNPGGGNTLPAVTLADNGTGANSTGASLTVESLGATSGTVTAGGTNNLLVIMDKAVPESSLHVNGDVTLNSSTYSWLAIDGNAAADASSLSVTGTVNLAGSAMSLYQYADGANCDTLTPGRTFTLVTATAITGAPGTSTVQPIANGCGGTDANAIISYGATSITATIAGVTAGSTPPQLSGTPVVGSTLSVTPGTWNNYDNGGSGPVYTYRWLANGTAITGATSSSYQLSSAEANKTIQVQVTATNAYGSASASSNPLGPVTTPPTSTTPTTTSPTTTTSGNSTPTPPSAAVIRAKLNGIGHPSTRKTVIAMLRSGIYRTTFHAPSAGALRITWTTTITTGTGKHRRHRTITLATASANPGQAGTVDITMRLTNIGRALLDRAAVSTVATEKFKPGGGGWTTLIKRFIL